MKKRMTILLSFIAVMCLAACGNDADRTKSPSAENNSAESGAEDEAGSSETQIENGDAQQSEPEPETPETKESKVLVAYFSATGTTEGVAEHIANGLNADIYEIIPEEPYTDADLNYNDSNSRSTIEMNDKASRPAISGSVENMEQYDTVFIGYPIWWGEAPRIVSTFVESYDFSGKTMVSLAALKQT